MKKHTKLKTPVVITGMWFLSAHMHINRRVAVEIYLSIDISGCRMLKISYVTAAFGLFCKFVRCTSWNKLKFIVVFMILTTSAS